MKMIYNKGDIIYNVTTNIFGELEIKWYEIIDQSNYYKGLIKIIETLICKDRNGNIIGIDTRDNIFTEYFDAFNFKKINIKFRECYREVMDEEEE